MFNVLDTFAGAGGFSLGFQMAGNEVIGGVEVDSWASETFVLNHPKATVIQRDLRQVSDGELMERFGRHPLDVLVGGPPCQGYSICRKDAGDPADPRNSLFMEFLRVARVLQPRVVIMENVPNIEKARTHQGELVVDIIRRELTELDYHVSHQILEATDYGIPQIRRRLFVIASTEPLKRPFPKPTHQVRASEDRDWFDSGLPVCPSLWEAISDLPELLAGEGEEMQSYPQSAANSYQRALRRNSRHIHNHTAMHHTPRMVERFASMRCGDSVSDVAAHLRPLRRNGNGEISETTYDQNNRRMHPNRPCHTIPASFYANFVHPFQHRNFTPREGARLQSFPDWFVFKGKPTVVSHKLLAREGRTEEKHLCQYNQIGNAVPPLLAKAIAENLMRQLKSEATYAHSR